MARMTPEQFAAHQSKWGSSESPKNVIKSEGKNILEKEIHKLISLECNRRGFLSLHGSTAHKTHRTIGEPDFVILTPKGRVLFVEVKTRSGRISAEQEDFANKAQLLGHEVHLVRSFEEFIQLIKHP